MSPKNKTLCLSPARDSETHRSTQDFFFQFHRRRQTCQTLKSKPKIYCSLKEILAILHFSLASLLELEFAAA
jgi:hypothetical protein